MNILQIIKQNKYQVSIKSKNNTTIVQYAKSSNNPLITLIGKFSTNFDHIARNSFLTKISSSCKHFEVLALDILPWNSPMLPRQCSKLTPIEHIP